MSIKSDPLVSIITIVYNGEKYLENCIESIKYQTYKNIQYIIIDGHSTDNTINIIKKHSTIINKFISEKDKGISDAFNKGIAIADGAIIGILNSDDFFNKDTIEIVVNSYKSKQNGSGIYFGDIRYFNNNMSYIRVSEISKIWKFMSLNHPSVFVTKDIYNKIGLFSEDYKYCMDAEFLHRAIYNEIPFYYINISLANFRLNGTSDFNYKKMYKEFYRSVQKYNDQGIITKFWYRWSIFKKNITKTTIGNYFYNRKHLLSFILSGKIKKG